MFRQVQACGHFLQCEVPGALACLSLVSVWVVTNTFSVHLVPPQISLHTRWHRESIAIVYLASQPTITYKMNLRKFATNLPAYTLLRKYQGKIIVHVLIKQTSVL